MQIIKSNGSCRLETLDIVVTVWLRDGGGKNMIRNCGKLRLDRQSSTELKHIKKLRDRRNQTEPESSYNNQQKGTN